MQQKTSLSESAASHGNRAGVIGIDCPVPSPPPPLHLPSPQAKENPRQASGSSMANYELDPQRFVPPGHLIIDDGDRRLPRTIFTPATRPPRRHEDYMVAEVMPAPEGPFGPVRNKVVQFLQNRGIMVRSAQPWFHGVGLFQVRDPSVRYTLVQHAPFPLGNDRFVRFMKHDEGENFKGTHGFRKGWLMFIGIPLDYRTTEYISQAVGTFGKFISWDSEDPYLVRTLVEASFPDTPLVPRDVVFGDYAEYGGAQVSWTTACYVLGADFAAQMPNDEAPMPLDGNPHPLPGNLVPDNLMFVLPPYPMLGWNDAPVAPPPPPENNEAPGWGNAMWGNEAEDEQALQPAAPEQDQVSIVIDQPEGSVSVDQPEPGIQHVPPPDL